MSFCFTCRVPFILLAQFLIGGIDGVEIFRIEYIFYINYNHSTGEGKVKAALFFGGVFQVFACCLVDLLASQPTKSSPHIHFVCSISLSFIPTSFAFNLPVSLFHLILLTIANL